MRKTGEWGEFFPSAISPFKYDETVAQEHFTKRVAPQEQSTFSSELKSAPADISDVANDILNAALACATCKKSFRVIPQELKFYREMKLPIPRKCPLCRYSERYNFRRPRKLFTHQCAKCKTEIKSCYSSDRPEIIYCEKCYLKEVY